MNKKVQGFLVLTMMASWLAGCGQAANPIRDPLTNTAENDNETLDEQANRGKNLGAFPNGVPRDTYQTTDLGKASQNRLARSAHGMAYELESLDSVKGCAVIVENGIAYVGVRPAEGYAFDDATETAIRLKIRRMDLNQNLQGIRVTAEPQAVEFLTGYSQALEQGRQIAGYQQEFQTMIAKTWPNGQE